jgi:hypothetical protein
MFRVADAVPIPVSINIGVGIRNRPATPAIPLPRLAALGVRRVSLPRMLPAAAIRAMEQAAALLRHSVGTRERVDRSDLLASIDDIKAHMDYEEPELLEERFLLPDHLLQRYGSRRVGIRRQRRSTRRRTSSSWARALIEDGAGGVASAVREGGSRIGARAVILAGHGFGADRELLARFCAEIAGALHVGAPEDPTIEALAARRSPDPAALRGTLEAAAARGVAADLFGRSVAVSARWNLRLSPPGSSRRWSTGRAGCAWTWVRACSGCTGGRCWVPMPAAERRRGLRLQQWPACGAWPRPARRTRASRAPCREPSAALHPVEQTKRAAHVGQQVELREPRRLVPLLHGELGADDAGDRDAVRPPRPDARQERQPPADRPGHVVGERRARGRQLDPGLGQAVVGGDRKSPRRDDAIRPGAALLSGQHLGPLRRCGGGQSNR